MMLHEAQTLLKKTEITEEQLFAIGSLYILLDLHKIDFCKIVDLVGIDKLLKKSAWYDRLIIADGELTAKERYLSEKARIENLEIELEKSKSYVSDYESCQKIDLNL